MTVKAKNAPELMKELMPLVSKYHKEAKDIIIYEDISGLEFPFKTELIYKFFGEEIK